jgi:RNA-directed DNA polymerase
VAAFHITGHNPAMQFTETQLDAAYAWLCHRRRHYPVHADVWHLRFHWAREKAYLLKLLNTQRYQFEPLQVVQRADGEVLPLWSSRDALVLKALSLLLAEVLPVSPACTHVKGHGGLKYTVQKVYDELPSYRFVLRTDVKEYYASIDHFLLMEQLAGYIKDKFILNLLWQYLHRMVERGGLYKEIQRGISRGCPLSPLIGAFFLSRLDEQFQHDRLFYVRYMDDILIMAPTRWKLRRAVKRLNETFTTLKLEKHPDKTFIGKIDRGFDFLGYHLHFQGLSVAVITWTKFMARLHRLYEQKKTGDNCLTILGEYARRWRRWTSAGLNNKEQIIQTDWTNKTPHDGGVSVGIVNTTVLSVLNAHFPSCYPN